MHRYVTVSTEFCALKWSERMDESQNWEEKLSLSAGLQGTGANLDESCTSI